MSKVLDCRLNVSRFELQLNYYVHFRTGLGKSMNPFPDLLGYGLNTITAVLL